MSTSLARGEFALLLPVAAFAFAAGMLAERRQARRARHDVIVATVIELHPLSEQRPGRTVAQRVLAWICR